MKNRIFAVWQIYTVRFFSFILEAENKSIHSNLTKDTFKAAPQNSHPSSRKQDTGVLAELELWHQASVAASNSILFWRTFVEIAWLIHQGTWLCRVYAWRGELNYRAVAGTIPAQCIWKCGSFGWWMSLVLIGWWCVNWGIDSLPLCVLYIGVKVDTGDKRK